MQEMHVILTAVTRTGARASFTGTVSPAPGTTRLKLYNDLLTKLAHSHGDDPENYAPLYFYLEPNRLDAN